MVFRVSLMSAGFCFFFFKDHLNIILMPNKYILGWHFPGGSAGWEDPLEKGLVTHSSILAWKIPWTVEPGGLQSMGLQRLGHD